MSSAVIPLQVGITGGIGSGKSIVCKLFACLDVPVYEADERAKWLTTHDFSIRQRIIGLLGEESYEKDGSYNRTYVALKVFNNPALLKSLNEIIHPAVLKDTEAWVEKNSGAVYVIKEAAIMKKAGIGNNLDLVVVVDADIALRIQRILKRDKRTEEEIRAIISRQISEAERAKIADFKVMNNTDSALIPQVLALDQQFRRVALNRH